MRINSARHLLTAILLLGALLSSGEILAVPSLLGASQEPEPVSLPADLAPGGVADFVAPLSDQDSRRLLIQTLQRDAESRGSGAESRSAGLLRSVEEGSARLSEERQAVLASLSNAGTHFSNAFRNLTGGEGFAAFAKGVMVFGIMILAGFTAEWLVGRKLDPVRQRLTQTCETAIRGRLGALAMRIVLDGASLFVFALVGWSVSFVFFERYDPMRIFAMAYLATITMTRIAWIISRAALAPEASRLRLMDLPDEWARRLHWWAILATSAGAFGFFTCALLKILGIDEALHKFLLIMVEAVLTGLLIAMVWRSRAWVASLLAGTGEPAAAPGYPRAPAADHGAVSSAAADSGLAETLDDTESETIDASRTERSAGPIRQALAQIWHLLATGYLLIVWWLYSRDVMLGAVEASEAAILSLLLLLAIPLVDAVLRALLDPGGGEPSKPTQRLGARYQRPIRTFARIALAVWVVMCVAEAAGLAVFGVMATPLGERINEALLDVAVALVIAYVVWELVKTAIDRNMPRDESGGAQIGEEGSSGKATRAATLLPLLRSFVLVVLVVMVTLIVLSSLGVNIGPLLAGAGVVGLAVGFGSQKLVQDIVAGIFFLVDDAFRVGEYIEAGGMKGTVESISIRSMRLRHHLGAVQTLPYGNIASVKNHSRDWVTMKLEIRLPYDVDIEKVRKTIKKTGQAMLDNPEYGHSFLQPLKSQGVFRVEDSALIVRMKFTTVPNEQWVIRREAYRLVKEALAAQGIEFAHRQVFVNVPEGDRNAAPDAAKAAAAAAAAIQAAEQQKAEAGAAPTTDQR